MNENLKVLIIKGSDQEVRDAVAMLKKRGIVVQIDETIDYYKKLFDDFPTFIWSIPVMNKIEL